MNISRSVPAGVFFLLLNVDNNPAELVFCIVPSVYKLRIVRSCFQGLMEMGKPFSVQPVVELQPLAESQSVFAQLGVSLPNQTVWPGFRRP